MKPLWSHFATLTALVIGGLKKWTSKLFAVSLFETFAYGRTDANTLMMARSTEPIVYPKPNCVITFNKRSA